jgi:hypothetical protein
VFDALKTPKGHRFYSLPSDFSTPASASTSSASAHMPSTPQTPCPSRPPFKVLNLRPSIEDDVFSDTAPARVLFDAPPPPFDASPFPNPLRTNTILPAAAARCDREHALALVGRTSPLADVDPAHVVAITLKCRRRDLETCGFVSWDVIATLQDMEEDGVRHSLVGEVGAPLVVLDYKTYQLPEGASLR